MYVYVDTYVYMYIYTHICVLELHGRAQDSAVDTWGAARRNLMTQDYIMLYHSIIYDHML